MDDVSVRERVRAKPKALLPSRYLFIDYESEDFPRSRGLRRAAQLRVTWNDILWAAITVGRPNRAYVFQHGPASVYEALFRFSLVRMALQQRGPSGRKLWRTRVFKMLDPTEKGAVNYFLGMTFCKLFADKLLGTPWLLHLDVFRHQLDARVLTGRSRPDLIGKQVSNRRWHAFESKGRATEPSSDEKTKAKNQAQRLVQVGSRRCQLHVGAMTYFKGDELRFFWRDPEPPQRGKPIAVRKPSWSTYYGPITALLLGDAASSLPGSELADTKTFSPVVSENSFIDEENPPPAFDGGRLTAVAGLDLSVGAHPKIREFLMQAEWQRAHELAMEHHKLFLEAGYQADGLVVKAGPSWMQRFKQS